MTRDETLTDLLSIAAAAAEEAASLVLASYRTRPSFDQKGPHDLVTEVDRASERVLTMRLSKLAPNIPIIGEETSGETAPRRGLAWYVDPIDGTTNFVHGHPFFCVAVGLMSDDEPVAGAVVAPALGLHWAGRRSKHARVALRNGEPCAVSEAPTLDRSLLATGFPPQRDNAPENNFDAFMAVKRSCQAVRRCGSAAIDLCFVADGTYDGYWERRLHAWDTAAGSAIVLAAGGTITSLAGGTPDYHKGNIAVTNGHIHRALLDVITRASS